MFYGGDEGVNLGPSAARESPSDWDRTRTLVGSKPTGRNVCNAMPNRITLSNELLLATVEEHPDNPLRWAWTVFPRREGDESIATGERENFDEAEAEAQGFIDGYKLAMDTVSEVVARLNAEAEEGDDD